MTFHPRSRKRKEEKVGTRTRGLICADCGVEKDGRSAKSPSLFYRKILLVGFGYNVFKLFALFKMAPFVPNFSNNVFSPFSHLQETVTVFIYLINLIKSPFWHRMYVSWYRIIYLILSNQKITLIFLKRIPTNFRLLLL
jgi:hypothetical protein